MRFFISLILFSVFSFSLQAQNRARELGIKIGVLPIGSLNAITDVACVKVGQVPLKRVTIFAPE